jgi:uncharacterized protein (TIGR02646 family)
MIFVDRSKEPVPQILLPFNSRGAKETIRSIIHHSGANRNKPFNFTVYKNQKVKEALVRLFNGKCAYCESKFLHVYPGDVEHFRPKGKVAEATPLKPGYYWLAADWGNLLLSCRNCNQKLAHQIHGNIGKKNMGKMDQFPLESESKRIRTHKINDGIAEEEKWRLLLNPCIDHPEDHFEYDSENALIKPKIINNAPSKKGVKSIEVYVLQRTPLVFAREKVLIQILSQIQRVKEAVINVNNNLTNNQDIQFCYDQILRREMVKLKMFTESTEEYSAMAKQVVNKFFKENFATISVNLS